MVGRRDRDDIDGLVVENAAHVLHEFRIALEAAGGLLADRSVGVADARNNAVFAGIVRLRVIAPSTADADDGDAEPLVGAAALFWLRGYR
jgi:hypothetical protein